MLFAAQLGPRQLTREQARHRWPQLNTRINLTDYMITWLVALLKDKTRRVNEDTAALLTAAGIHAKELGTSGWSAEAVKKRRMRVLRRWLPWTSMWGPRFVLSRLSIKVSTARQPQPKGSDVKNSTATNSGAWACPQRDECVAYLHCHRELWHLPDDEIVKELAGVGLSAKPADIQALIEAGFSDSFL